MTLIERLEAAEGGNREFEGLIEVEVRAFEASKTGIEKKHWAVWRSNMAGQISDGHTFYDAPHVTTSLNAAIDLADRVHSDWLKSIMIGHGKAVAHFRSGSITNPDTVEVSGYSSRPELALCAAILRAIQPKEGEG